MRQFWIVLQLRASELHKYILWIYQLNCAGWELYMENEKYIFLLYGKQFQSYAVVVPVFWEGWPVCRSSTTCSTGNSRMLNTLLFKLGTLFHINVQMLPISLHIICPKLRSFWFCCYLGYQCFINILCFRCTVSGMGSSWPRWGRRL